MDRLIVPSKEDLKATVRREHRLQEELQRKARIFNDRTRLIGIDKQALDQHVHNKQQQKQQEKTAAENYASELRQQNAILSERIKDLAIERQRIQKEVIEYRQQHQRKDQAREFDLNDPRYIQQASSFQGFGWLGEDLSHQQRKQQQKEQMRQWLQQQMHERQQIQQDRQAADRAMEIAMIRHDTRLQDIDCSERRLRRQVHCRTAVYNKELADVRKTQAEQLRQQNEEDNLTEITNHLTSDMLLEDKELAMASNLFGGKRICSYMYRGMTEDQLKAIREEQRNQIEAKKLEAHKNRKNQVLCEQEIESKSLALENKHLELEKKRRQAIAEQNKANLLLSMEQKKKNDYMNNVAYTFQPDDEYFEQFNKSTR